MRRPRIGISMDTGLPDEKRRMLELNADYPGAVLRAGGLPLLLPHARADADRREMLSLLDGLIIPGGDDCDPALYGQSLRDGTRTMDALRQAFDLAMLALAEERSLPTLGICLGCQLMNVQRGGTLFQSLTEQRPESTLIHARSIREYYPAYGAHDVSIRPGYKLAGIFQSPGVAVNSRHRQGLDKIGDGLVATAAASDGLVEAIEDPTLPFWVGVQWHPENMIDTPQDKLFTALIEAAKARLAQHI